MPGLAVIDASVVLKWQLNDEESIHQAIELRKDYCEEGIIRLIAPYLLIYEVINGIATAMRKNRISLDKSFEALQSILTTDVELKEVQPYRVLELYQKYGIASYDAAYLALAEAEKCDLWTGDSAFYRAVKNELPYVKWIGNYGSLS